jgi:hypothetical protein
MSTETEDSSLSPAYQLLLFATYLHRLLVHMYGELNVKIFNLIRLN